MFLYIVKMLKPGNQSRALKGPLEAGLSMSMAMMQAFIVAFEGWYIDEISC